MCIYRYVYYTNCRHAEFYKVSYCEKAKAFGQPQGEDRWRYLSEEAANNPANQTGPSSDNRSSATGDSREAAQGSSSNTQQRSHNPPSMSTAAPSEPAPVVRSWAAIAAASPGNERLVGDRIPRSVQSDINVPGPASQAPVYHQNASQTNPPFDMQPYNKLNINIPLDPYSSFSMNLTHQDGDARTRASSGSTAREPESETDNETIRGFPINQSPGIARISQPTEYSTQASSVPQLNAGLQVPPKTMAGSSSDKPEGGRPLLSNSKRRRKKDKGKGKEVATPVDDTEKADPQSPRKPIPSQWTGKSQVPTLATAQRAMQRESRKKGLLDDSPTEAGRKTIRGSRSAVDMGKSPSTEITTFLTKEAAAAVESDITSQPASRTSGKLRPTASKASLQSSVSLPVPTTAGRSSTIKVTVSPTRSQRMPISNVDGSGQSRAADENKPGHAPSSVSSAGGTPYMSTRHSPVSQDSTHSEHSFTTCREHMSDVDLTDAGDVEQKTMNIDGRHSPTHKNARGESEPQLKAQHSARKLTTTRKPKLSLRIPHSSSFSTDRKSPLALVSASSSASRTPASPSPSSRIPRITSPMKAEQAHSDATLRRSKSTRSLLSGNDSAVPRDPEEENKGRYTVDLFSPHAVPLPETPAPAPVLRHVRTVNSEGETPIMSPTTPKMSGRDTTPTRLPSSLREDDVLSVSTTPIDDPPAQSPVDKQAMVETYLENIPHAGTMPIEETKTHVGTGGMLSSSDPPDFLSASELSEHPLGSEEHAPDVARQGQGSRVTSIGSEATVRATPMLDDPVLHDPAIIYSRRRSDTSGTYDLFHGEASTSATSGSIGMSRGPSAEYNTSSSRDRTRHYVPQIRRETSRELSHPSNLLSELRAEAAEFVPRQETAEFVPMHERPAIPEQWTMQIQAQQYELDQLRQLLRQPPQAESGPFNPLALDTYGIPLYHYMYPVTVGPGTAFDFSDSRFSSYYNPSSAGRNRGNTNRTPMNRRQRRAAMARSGNTSSPTRRNRSDETSATLRAEGTGSFEQEGGDRTPRPTPASLDRTPHATPSTHAQPEYTSVAESSTAASSASGSGMVEQAPFASQMESVSRQATAENQRPVGRGSRRKLDLTLIRNVQDRNQHQPPAFLAPQGPSSMRGYGQQSNVIHSIPEHGYYTMPHQSRSGRPYPRQNEYAVQGTATYHAYRSGPYRSRGFHPPAGVPLDATAPFPDPVGPSGPRRDEDENKMKVEGGDSKEYVGYVIPDKQVCGEVILQDAREWIGSICNKCLPDEHMIGIE